MAWFRKKTDPITDRSRALTDDIARIEAQIKNLDAQLQHDQSQPRLRSTALPHGATVNAHAPAPPVRRPEEPIFESIARDRLEPQADGMTTRAHYNDLGVRKYDLPALLRRVRNHWRGPSTANPQLVNYLAAGGIQGLRPLRYEKRVARNRFVFVAIFIFVVLLGTFLYLHYRGR